LEDTQLLKPNMVVRGPIFSEPALIVMDIALAGEIDVIEAAGLIGRQTDIVEEHSRDSD